MNMTDVKNKITETLQNGLIGHLKLSSKLNPRTLTDAIIQNTDILRPYNNFKNKHNQEIIDEIRMELFKIKEDMSSENQKLFQSDESEDYKKLLGNFIRGQLTAIDKINCKLNIIEENEK